MAAKRRQTNKGHKRPSRGNRQTHRGNDQVNSVRSARVKPVRNQRQRQKVNKVKSVRSNGGKPVQRGRRRQKVRGGGMKGGASKNTKDGRLTTWRKSCQCFSVDQILHLGPWQTSAKRSHGQCKTLRHCERVCFQVLQLKHVFQVQFVVAVLLFSSTRRYNGFEVRIASALTAFT